MALQLMSESLNINIQIPFFGAGNSYNQCGEGGLKRVIQGLLNAKSHIRDVSFYIL